MAKSGSDHSVRVALTTHKLTTSSGRSSTLAKLMPAEDEAEHSEDECSATSHEESELCSTTICQGTGQQRTKGIDDPFERLRIFIDNHLSFFAANMAEMKVLSHEAESLAGDLHKHVSTKKERYARVARKILREIAEQERTHGGVDLTVATYALFGMMNWIYNWYDPRGKLSVNQLVDNITRLFLVGFISAADAEFSLSEPAKAERLSIWRSA